MFSLPGALRVVEWVTEVFSYQRRHM